MHRAAGAGVAMNVVLEQPVKKEDLDGLSQVTSSARRYGIGVAADEACRSLEDAYRLCGLTDGDNDDRHRLCCDIINIKLSKVGVIAALSIAALCVHNGVELMIGGMVETRLGMGFAACFAAGLDCFEYIDLDTPLLLAEDAVYGDGATLCQSSWRCNSKHAGGLGLSVKQSDESIWFS